MLGRILASVISGALIIALLILAGIVLVPIGIVVGIAWILIQGMLA